ncbi:MAG: extracellular solute-binding protein [Vigna little leaf phytoplasma]|nr:extracellular solute-binding protein [Vigna little leaf phytoplasma]
MNKKILILSFILCIITLITCLNFNKEKKKVILLFNWGEYIDPQVIDSYNNKVDNKFMIKQSFFSSNELAINKIKTGNVYDIAILSEYAIEQLNKDYLQKIDQSKINLPEKTDLFDKIEAKLTDQKMEMYKEYSIPYFWGNLGILYNTKKIKIEDLQNNNWKSLVKNNNNNYKIALYNNAFEGMFIGLKATGGDLSGNSEEDNQKAKEWLLDLKRHNMNLSFVTDQILDNMKIKDQENYDLVITYSGDARFLINENPNLKYYDFRNESKDNKGTNIWVDSFVLPKGSNTEGAYDFIRFALEKENIKKNIKFINYDTPYKIDESPNHLKLSINEEDKFYKYNEKTKQQINNAWNEIYSLPRPDDYYLFAISFIILSFLIIMRFYYHFQNKEDL